MKWGGTPLITTYFEKPIHQRTKATRKLNNLDYIFTNFGFILVYLVKFLFAVGKGPYKAVKLFTKL